MKNQNYVVELIDLFLADKQRRVAVKVFDGMHVSDVFYYTLAEDILRAANFLKKRNIIEKNIALIGENSYNWLVSFFAIVASGNVAVLLNPGYPKEVHIQQCKWTDAFLVCGNKTTATSMSKDIYTVSYEEMRADSPMSVEEIVNLDSDATTVMMFTSGTLGKSKIVELNYDNLLSSIQSAEMVFSVAGIDKIMTVLPMFHISGLRGALAMLRRYKTLCIGRGAMYLFKDMPVLSPDYVLLVPLMAESLVKQLKNTSLTEARKKLLGTNLKRICIGGANIDPQVCQYLLDQGILIDSGYGMTETTGVGTWGEWDMAHYNTIGKLSDQIQCKIVDGELLFKGAAVMKGYYRDFEATAAVIKDGWFYSGDLGYCDAEGFYYITGRKKNLIVLPNGEKINPEEVEAHFKKHPAIQECVVFYYRNGLCMQVFTHDYMTVQNIVDEYNEEMPMSYHIHKIFVSEEPLEKNEMGKLVRRRAAQ